MNKLIYAVRYLYYRIFYGFYHLGWPVGFGKGVYLRNSKNISLGNGVLLVGSSIISVADEHAEYDSVKPQLKLEDNVRVNMFTMISAVKSVHIKKNVNIGQFCFIGDHDHGYKDVTKPIKDQGLTNVKPVVINEDTWIANKVTVVSGVTIGKHCVIGANSVVTKDIPDYCVAVGAPAKVIKKYNFKTKRWEKVKS